LFNVLKILAIMCFAALPSSGRAADISLVNGFFYKTADKVDGKNAGSTSLFGLGARYHEDMGGDLGWYGRGDLAMRSYSAADGRKAPGSSTSILIGGGVRNYFKPFAAGVVPFVGAGGDVRSQKSAEFSGSGFKETESSGLYYEGNAGIRAGLDSDFFVEVEVPLFVSPLFASTKEVSFTDLTGTEVKEETSSSSLWVDSSAPISQVRFGLGYKF
jgi:hypothetical protein